jgi:hypothetical protein
LACNNAFKHLNSEAIFELEKLHARVKLMENKQEIYQRYVDYLKGE